MPFREDACNKLAKINLRENCRSFGHQDAPGKLLMVERPSPSAIVVPIGHATETNSLHHEKFNKERRRVLSNGGARRPGFP
jgi:hypothetical protein